MKDFELSCTIARRPAPLGGAGLNALLITDGALSLLLLACS
jgi:hypothetical protein